MMRSTLLAVLLVLSGPALADEDADNYRVPNYKIGKVVKIDVTKATVREDFDPKESCDTFVMTRKRATFFIEHSRVTSRHNFVSESMLSSCASEGTVKLSNGDEARWAIYRVGRGIMTVAAGKRKGKVVHLHCNKCEDWDF
jgi:hypothetical protein